MGFAVQIDITKDTATPMLARAREFILPSRLNPIVGRSAVNVYRKHLFGLNKTRPNKLGGARTNYYATAARQTNFKVISDDAVLISIPQIGIGQRYYGGVIKPRVAKFLTIAANPAAYGHRASEFDLEIVFGHDGQPIALATKSTRATQVTQNKRGKTVTKQIGRHGEIMFLLRRSVNQKPDPTILPYDEQVTAQIGRDVKSAFDRDIARGLQGSSNGGAS